MPSEMLTTAQAAERLGVGPTYVALLCQRGEIRADRFGKAWLIHAESVEAYAARPPKPKRRNAPAGGMGLSVGAIADMIGVTPQRASEFIVTGRLVRPVTPPQVEAFIASRKERRKLP